MLWLCSSGLYEHMLQYIMGILQRRQLRHSGTTLKCFNGQSAFDLNDWGWISDFIIRLSGFSSFKFGIHIISRKRWGKLGRWRCCRHRDRLHCRHGYNTLWDLGLHAKEDRVCAEPGTGIGSSEISRVDVTDRVFEFLCTGPSGERSPRPRFRRGALWYQLPDNPSDQRGAEWPDQAQRPAKPAILIP